MKWLRSVLSRRAPARRLPAPRPCRLDLEVLEDRLTPSADILVTTPGTAPQQLFQEYTPTGGLVRSVVVPPPPGSSGDTARDLVANSAGNVYVYNGTFSPALATYSTQTKTWTQQTYPGWDTQNIPSFGGIGLYQNYVFATDMAVNGDPNGIVRFNTSNGTVTRFGQGNDFINLSVGLDGKVYALNGPIVSVYDPNSLALLRQFQLQANNDYRAIAVNAAGDVFTANWNGSVTHFNSAGVLLGTFGISTTPMSIAVAPDGTLAVGTRLGVVWQMTSSFTNVTNFRASNYPVFAAFATWQFPPPLPAVSVSDTSVVEGNPNTGYGPPAAFQISLSAPSNQPVTVSFSTADGTATAGTDYAPISGTINFNPGQTTQTIYVPINIDPYYDGSETFTLNITKVANATIARGQGTATIVDSLPPPTISVGNVTVTSAPSDYVTVSGGNSPYTAADFPVTLSGPSRLPVTVYFGTADGTAIAGSDYQGIGGQLTFAPGQISQVVAVGINGDPYYEPNETFTLKLTNPSGGTLGRAQATGTIVSSLPPPTISVGNVTVTNGTSGTTPATFTVSLSEPLSDGTSIAYTTADGTATAGNDYTPINGTLNFAPGQTSQTVTVNVTGDPRYDPNETFSLDLVPLAGGSPYATGTATIVSGLPQPTLSVSDATVTDGTSGTTPLTFTVTLSAPASEPVTVAYATADGSADAGTAYQAASGTLTFAPGQTSQTITVDAIGNPLYAPTQTFTVNLSSPTVAALGQAQGTGTIVSSLPPPYVNIGGVYVTDVDSGTTPANFYVWLSPGSSVPVTVDYTTVDGSAVAGTDYVATNGTLTFAPGQTWQYVTVPVIGNPVYESARSFSVVLSNPQGARIGSQGGNGTIFDDAPFASIDVGPSQTLNEGDTVQFDAGGSHDLDGDPLTYTWDFGDGSTTAGLHATHVYADNGVYTATVSVSDGSAVTTASATVTVLNVAPTTAISGPTDAVPAQVRTFTFAATDPSPVDQAAGFTYQVDWGDGTTQMVQGPGAGVQVAHAYTATGAYTVSVTATDKDGGTGPVATQAVTVVTAELQGSDLYVGGTSGDDTIIVRSGDVNGDVEVVLNGQSLGTFAATGQIVVYGGAGNDTIEVNTPEVQGFPQLTLPVMLFGGDGNDVLDAGGTSGAAVLVGGAGNDTLYASAGRSILIGGTGWDVLYGNTDDDILIGGTTSYDADLPSLVALRNEWARTDADFATRIAHLNGTLAGGLNGNVLLDAQTVFGDNAGNFLDPWSGTDWVFAALGGSNPDVIFNQQPGDVITPL